MAHSRLYVVFLAAIDREEWGLCLREWMWMEYPTDSIFFIHKTSSVIFILTTYNRFNTSICIVNMHALCHVKLDTVFKVTAVYRWRKITSIESIILYYVHCVACCYILARENFAIMPYRCARSLPTASTTQLIAFFKTHRDKEQYSLTNPQLSMAEKLTQDISLGLVETHISCLCDLTV